MRGFGIVSRAVVGVEAVTGFIVDDDFGGRFDGSSHLLHGFKGNTSVLPAIKADDGRFQSAGDIEGILWCEFSLCSGQSPIPGRSGANLRSMGRVEPRRPSPPAEAGNPQPVGIYPVALRPSDRGVQIGQNLSVWHLRNNAIADFL